MSEATTPPESVIGHSATDRLRRFFHQLSQTFRIETFFSETGLILPVLGIVVGLLGGFGALAFRYLIGFFQGLIYSTSGDLTTAAHTLPWWRILIGPAIGGLVVGPLVYFFAREAKGHGVPEVMDAVATKGGRIRKRVAFVKILASAICIGSGGSVGREGPYSTDWERTWFQYRPNPKIDRQSSKGVGGMRSGRRHRSDFQCSHCRGYICFGNHLGRFCAAHVHSNNSFICDGY